jgi:hypothetical protein
VPDRVAESLASRGRPRTWDGGPREQAEKLRRMVGFRDVAVREAPNPAIVREVIRNHLDDLLAFAAWALGRAG